MDNQVFHEVEDSRLQRFLKQAIAANPFYYNKLKNIYYCGIRNVKIPGQAGGTHIISNGKYTRILGVKNCRHSWGCPHCTAREMRKHSQNIGAAITKLKEQNLVPIMITLTVFHTNKETAAEVLQLLKDTYTRFTKLSRWKGSADRNKYTKAGAWCNFCTEFNIRHSVKVMEVTYGEHGWHPHFHNLYWIPKDKLNEIGKWEDDLRAQWLNFEKTCAKKIFDEEHNEIREFLYQKSRKKFFAENGYDEGLYISKDNNGKVCAMEASDYICGWGGNDELTNADKKSGGLKTGKKGHYTLNQMLNEAYYHNNTKLLDKYLEWLCVIADTRTHRIDYSRTGLKPLIEQYKRTEAYRDCMKKKRTHATGGVAPYHTVAYFKSEDWREICYFDTHNDSDIPIIELIICFAKYKDGYDLIKLLMEVNNLPMPYEKAPGTDIAELFNDMLENQWNYAEDEAIFRDTKIERDKKIKLATHFIVTSLKSFYSKRGFRF